MDYWEKPKIKLFFDIETIPVDGSLKDIAVKIAIDKEISRLGKVKKGKKYEELLFKQTAISGDFGRIFCIGYATNNDEALVIKGSEKDILIKWWEIANKADLFVGHNIMDFDLRFIFKRSIVNKILPSAKHLNLSFARYRSFPIFDTMREWEKWNTTSFIKLDSLAKILGIASSKDGGIDGSQVYDFFLKGKYDEIYEYCKRDVVVTRKIYKRMTFENS